MINFLRYIKIYFLLSGSFILIAIFSLVYWGLNPSVDFTGGSLLEIKAISNPQNINSEKITANFPTNEMMSLSSVQYSSESNSYVLKLNTIDENAKNQLISDLNARLDVVIEVLRFDTVGPTLGRELLIKTFFAILVAATFIMGYVAYQFKDKLYGISAIVAMVHDSLILLGSFALFGKFLNVEIDTLFVTALLTTLSFSVHDTIVVFDRIREKVTKTKNINLYDAINQAISETMPRSLNNSLTIVFMLAVLVLLGGITIRWFAVALLIGTIAGTYSSPFVATTLLYQLNKVDFKKLKKKLLPFVK